MLMCVCILAAASVRILMYTCKYACRITCLDIKKCIMLWEAENNLPYVLHLSLSSAVKREIGRGQK